MDVQWTRYFEITKDKPAHSMFDLLDEYLPEAGRAIDLGCGPGRGTLRLLARGLEVTAVDIAREALDLVRERVPADAPLTLVCGSLDEVALAPPYDVAVGCFSLFFLEPDRFARFWPHLVDAIAPGGLWAGQFLGVRDTWRERGYTVHTREEAEHLLDGFEILHFSEMDEDGATATGDPKHWHVFHTIARRRP
jgi:tellurite methyltransferase